jgi:hypothetical protein
MAVLSFFANPHRFMAASKWFAWGFTAAGLGGDRDRRLDLGLFAGAARRRQQGDSARIMFVHVPAMWLCAVRLRLHGWRESRLDHLASLDCRCCREIRRADRRRGSRRSA